MSFSDAILFSIGVILFQNIILTNFLGVCTFFTDLYKDRPFHSMFIGTAFLITTNSVISHLVYDNLLVPNGLEFLFIVIFALISYIIIQLTEILSKRFSRFLKKNMSTVLPLIVTNCLLFGTSILTVKKDYPLNELILFCIVASFGYTFTLYVYSYIIADIDEASIIEPAKGMPIGFIILAIISLTFSGLSA